MAASHNTDVWDSTCFPLKTADDKLLNLDQQIPATSLRICRPGALDQPDLFSEVP